MTEVELIAWCEELGESNDSELPFYIDQIRERVNANELTLLTKKGVIVVSSSKDTKSLVPDTPGETILLQLAQNNKYIGIDLIRDKLSQLGVNQN